MVVRLNPFVSLFAILSDIVDNLLELTLRPITPAFIAEEIPMMPLLLDLGDYWGIMRRCALTRR
jgi:hypothetical protein